MCVAKGGEEQEFGCADVRAVGLPLAVLPALFAGSAVRPPLIELLLRGARPAIAVSLLVCCGIAY